MMQKAIYCFELLIVVSFVFSLLFRARPEKPRILRVARISCCVLFGVIPPLLVFLHAQSAADLGGPLFLPLLAALSAMFGFSIATAFCFFIFQFTK